MAGRYDLEVDVGASYHRPISFSTRYDDGTVTDWDLTGCTAKLVIRPSDRSWYESYDLPIVDNQVVIDWAPEQTAPFWIHRAYYYWLDITFSDGTVRRELEGHVRPRPSGVSGACYVI